MNAGGGFRRVATSDADRLTLYLAAEEAILTGGASVSINGRSQTMADLPGIQKMIDALQNRAARANSGPILLGRPPYR